MSSDGINAVEFGRLVESVDNLTTAVEKLTSRMERQEAHMVDVQKDKAKAQGIVVAMTGVGSVFGVLVKIGWDYLTTHKP